MKRQTNIITLISNITVIIPAYNEEKNIEKVINIAKKSQNVREIIVVDNNSTDNTYRLAKSLGTRVIKCINKGKGFAMEAGLKYAKYSTIVFLDADVDGYEKNVIEKLTGPIINGKADFVKGTFKRMEGGTVTNVAVKPLLNILFPEMFKFSEPLCGMIASKKSILKQMSFEKDYGVDIGILLDTAALGAKIKQINIGKIKNMSHIGKTQDITIQMSSEVMKAIIKRGHIEQIDQVKVSSDV